MEREILFRGKRIDNGEWESGSLVRVRMGCSDERVYIADKMTGYLTPVIPETVGEWTGLKDKNGKKIFEGDIIWAYGSQELTVKWNEQDACFEGVFDGKKSGIPDDDNDDYAPACDFNYLEIIGNIHEEVTK